MSQGAREAVTRAWPRGRGAARRPAAPRGPLPPLPEPCQVPHAGEEKPVPQDLHGIVELRHARGEQGTSSCSDSGWKTDSLPSWTPRRGPSDDEAPAEESGTYKSGVRGRGRWEQRSTAREPVKVTSDVVSELGRTWELASPPLQVGQGWWRGLGNDTAAQVVYPPRQNSSRSRPPSRPPTLQQVLRELLAPLSPSQSPSYPPAPYRLTAGSLPRALDPGDRILVNTLSSLASSAMADFGAPPPGQAGAGGHLNEEQLMSAVRGPRTRLLTRDAEPSRRGLSTRLAPESHALACALS